MSKIQDLKSNIRSVLIASKDGIPSNRFISEYQETTMENISPQEFGFSSLHELLQAMPDTVNIRNGDRGFVYFAVVDETTARLSQLVSRQKSKKSQRGKSFGGRGRYTPVASRGKPPSRFMGSSRVTAKTAVNTASINPRTGTMMGSQPGKDQPQINWIQRPPLVPMGKQFHQQIPKQMLPQGRQVRPVHTIDRSGHVFSAITNFLWASAKPPGYQVQTNKQPSQLCSLVDRPGYIEDPYEDLYDHINSDGDDENFPVENAHQNEVRKCDAAQSKISPRFVNEFLRLNQKKPAKLFEVAPQPSLESFMKQDLVAYLTYLISPTKFYVHLQQEDKVQEVMDNCFDLSKTMPDIQKSSEVEVGQLILYQCRFDDAWCRAQLLPNDSVLMIDFGSKEPFNPSRAKWFAEKLTRYPVLARQCQLANVVASGNGWKPNAKEEMDRMCEGVELNLRVLDVKFASPEQQNPTLVVAINAEGEDVADMLVKCGFASYTHSHEKSPRSELELDLQPEGKETMAHVNDWLFKSTVDASGDNDDRMSKKGTSSNKNNLQAFEDWASLVPQRPSAVESSKCVITHVEPDGSIYLQFLAEKGPSYLRKLLRLINKFSEIDDIRLCVSIPNCGQIYAVYDKKKCMFARAMVTSFEEEDSSLSVYFIDQGYSANVDLNSLRSSEPFEPAISMLPAQALRFNLAYVDYSQELFEDYLRMLVESKREMNAWSEDEDDRSSVILQMPDGRFLYDVLEDFLPAETYEQSCNIYRGDFCSLSHLEDTLFNFTCSHGRFHRILPDEVVVHGDNVTFHVIAVMTDRLMKIVSEENYEKYFLKLAPDLKESCQEMGETTAALSELLTGAYFLVRSSTSTPEISSEPCSTESQYKFHRCKLADHICGFFFTFDDIDTGEFVYAHRKDVFVLPDKFYGPEYPVVTWSACFAKFDQQISPRLVGNKLTRKAVYPDRDCVSFV